MASELFAVVEHLTFKQIPGVAVDGRAGAACANIRVVRVMVPPDEAFPGNSALPLLIYKDVLSGNERTYGKLKTLLPMNGWEEPWFDVVYSYHHYHEHAWEALVITKGRADVQFGGPRGPTLEIIPGDLVLIPPARKLNICELEDS